MPEGRSKEGPFSLWSAFDIVGLEERGDEAEALTLLLRVHVIDVRLTGEEVQMEGVSDMLIGSFGWVCAVVVYEAIYKCTNRRTLF